MAEFYSNQPKEKQEKYKELLKVLGSLSRLYSESNEPYLPYRTQENLFCYVFEAENISRKDCSIDAKKEKIGIGLKTWVGSDDQKVAEFDELSYKLKGLSNKEIIRAVSEWRNKRIDTTMEIYGVDEMLYHVIKRENGTMGIYECDFDKINIDYIYIDPKVSKNNIYFLDGKHFYHYSLSKNTLYMKFLDMNKLDEVNVNIKDNPFIELLNMEDKSELNALKENVSETLCLRLYSESGGRKFVPEKSQLNQWNADGRTRDVNEVYIAYPAEDRRRSIGFFPERKVNFDLFLPDGSLLSASVCQADGKAIMSNPNKALGEWLLRKVFKLKERQLLTYEMLLEYGIDSVVFKKLGNSKYSIDFCPIGTYEEMLKGNQNNLDE